MESLTDVFILTYEKMRRYNGSWHIEKKILFPERVFLESKDEKTLENELSQCQYFMEGKTSLIPIRSQDEALLRNLCGKEKLLKMSRGVIQRGTTKITEGPLKGNENRICKIDRHKRLARLEFVGRELETIWAGLEIVDKS